FITLFPSSSMSLIKIVSFNCLIVLASDAIKYQELQNFARRCGTTRTLYDFSKPTKKAIKNHIPFLAVQIHNQQTFIWDKLFFTPSEISHVSNEMKYILSLSTLNIIVEIMYATDQKLPVFKTDYEYSRTSVATLRFLDYEFRIRLAQAASGCAPSVEVLSISDV
ncbi:hypothetical protein WN51_08203, partial [Melipona quadrifasciata]